jgi:hypothetical protein
MHNILHQCQQKLGSWVGSSVIHLGQCGTICRNPERRPPPSGSQPMCPLRSFHDVHALLCCCVALLFLCLLPFPGDHNVPNALSFIDKYTQVSRILNPIVLTLKAIPRLCEKPDVKYYIDRIFGGAEALKMLILTDFVRNRACNNHKHNPQRAPLRTHAFWFSPLVFAHFFFSLIFYCALFQFRHGFDGSGADNFFDAGSCIDGRLTSAWQWCNKLEKKSYYTIFQLSGFSSFDGQWSD